MIGRWWMAAVAMLFATASLAIAEPNEGGQDELSQANKILFMTDHLQEVKEPSTLHYEFSKTGTLEAGFKDTVDVRVANIGPDGSKRVEFQCFTGDNREEFPPVENARGNPVLLFFLQRDVGEMQRLTEGHWRHFQNQIKRALADSAEIKPVSIKYGGKDIQATQVRITPYVTDAYRSRFEKFANKYYEFTLAEQVPGKIYEVRSVIPGENGTLLEERLTFRQYEMQSKK